MPMEIIIPFFAESHKEKRSSYEQIEKVIADHGYD